MESQENNKTKIIFNNEPKLSEHEVDSKFNERRSGLIPYVKDFISNHELFRDKEVGVTFAEKGVSSLVCIIEAVDEKFVLKIPLSLTYSEGEALFLNTWEDAGVKVPHVIEGGTIGDHSYILMEHIDAPTISESGSDDYKFHIEMGDTLRRMHEPEAQGYGHVVDGKAEFETFEEWLNGPDMKKRIDYVKEHELLSDDHGSLDNVLEILTQQTKKEDRSSYCHDDFGGSNIFDTDPITVFDPNPRFNNRYIDLGKTIVNHIAAGISPDKIIEGYFGSEPYSEQALVAGTFLNTLMKLPYQHKKNRTEVMKNLKEYLVKNKHILEESGE